MSQSNRRTVVTWGTADDSKPRVRILLEGIQNTKLDLIQCRDNPWQNIRDKSQLNIIKKILIVAKLIIIYPKLIVRYLRLPQHDYVLLAYPAQLDLLIIWPFAKIRGAKIVWDVFISAYDTIIRDRELISRFNPIGSILYLMEWLEARLADLVFLDTKTHARYFERLYHLQEQSIKRVLVGVEKEQFYPLAPKPPNNNFKVLFYGQFIPLHGIDIIIRAAQRIQKVNKKISFTIIGQGQEQPKIDALIKKLGLSNINRISWVPYDQLIEQIKQADVVLGIFGQTGKAQRVIPNKVFQVMATGRPLITADTPAIREIIRPDENLHLIPEGSAKALASRILCLPDNATQKNKALVIDDEQVGQQFYSMLKNHFDRPYSKQFGLAALDLKWVPAPSYILRRHLILKIISNFSKGSVLELGSGAGTILYDLARKKYSGLGVESSSPARKIANHILEPFADVSVQDKLPEKSKQFDYLMSFEVLEHIKEDQKALNNWAWYLKKGGLMFLSVPAHKSKWNANDVWAGHFRRYEKKDLQKKLTKAGLKIIKIYSYGWPLATLMDPLRAKIYKIKKGKQKEKDSQAKNTAASGIDRTLELKLYKYYAGFIGKMFFKLMFWLQDCSLNTHLGTGYLIIARKS